MRHPRSSAPNWNLPWGHCIRMDLQLKKISKSPPRDLPLNWKCPEMFKNTSFDIHNKRQEAFTRDPPSQGGSNNTVDPETTQDSCEQDRMDDSENEETHLEYFNKLGINLNEVDDVTRTWLEAMNFDKMGLTQKS
ncbi:hypothetical protein AMATHDRAFT_9207 [Amanita thiersii Skay4041]|uniref:Uncharacterized protein n=1 Tax=Amanita thiersii Skay4041 TaxID=703135 RepID=A0A2A9NCJ8_9AGAR|nr:hypothetical protein AMATHDRAFT_9207 [Amanita thiersii Skay4041]